MTGLPVQRLSVPGYQIVPGIKDPGILRKQFDAELKSFTMLLLLFIPDKYYTAKPMM